MKKILKILFGLIAFSLLVWGFYDKKELFSLQTGQDEALEDAGGAKVAEMTTYDGLYESKGKLYDATSLMPAGLSVKDCKT